MERGIHTALFPDSHALSFITCSIAFLLLYLRKIGVRKSMNEYVQYYVHVCEFCYEVIMCVRVKCTSYVWHVMYVCMHL